MAFSINVPRSGKVLDRLPVSSRKVWAVWNWPFLWHLPGPVNCRCSDLFASNLEQKKKTESKQVSPKQASLHLNYFNSSYSDTMIKLNWLIRVVKRLKVWLITWKFLVLVGLWVAGRKLENKVGGVDAVLPEVLHCFGLHHFWLPKLQRRHSGESCRCSSHFPR